MIIQSYSHIGEVRDKNEDSILADPALNLAVVADGIGGHEAGEVASAIAVSLLSEQIRENSGAFSTDILKEAFFQANHAIYTLAKEDDSKHNMGTTMTAAWFNNEQILLVHVGDTRAYLISGDTITQLTDDHSVAGELVKKGNITPEQAGSHPQRNVLTRSLGTDTLVKVDEITQSWKNGDYLLLCSDGLYDLVTDQEILETMLNGGGSASACQELIKKALFKGGFDNISVIIVGNR